MFVTQKTQYGLRAVFELAKRYGRGPIKIGEVAKVQAIPQRFLEAILSQLKQAGVVDSRRGKQGGYFLVRDPSDVTVDDVIAVLQGPTAPIACISDPGEPKCDLFGECVFMSLWTEVQDAIQRVYQRTTFQTLLDREKEERRKYVPNFTI